MADSKCSSGKLAVIPYRRHKKANVELNLFNNLCDELVAEILLRLPTKSAVQFQVICKRWYSLISSPYFVSRFIHLRHNIPLQSSFVFQITYNCDRTKHYDFHIISEDSSLLRNFYGERGFNSSLLTGDPLSLELEASFADLILCSRFNQTKETIYYVFNLLTRQRIALPLPPPPPPADVWGFILPVSIGFLCVPVESPHHHYKFMVVRLRTCECSIPRSSFNVQVFSSQDSQWRDLVVSSPLNLNCHTGKTSLVAYRGMLHWLIRYCIVVYDPLNTPQTFSRIIELPPLMTRSSYFGVCQDRLRVVGFCFGAQDPDVWELEDYDSGLWKLVHKVYLKNLIPNGLRESLKSELYSLSVLSLHPQNGDVIYLRILSGVVHVNLKSKIIEHYYPIKKNAKSSWINAFHLTDQWWPTPLSSLH